MIKDCIQCSKKFETMKSGKYCSLFCRLKFHSKEKDNGCWESDFKSINKGGYTSIKFADGVCKSCHRLMYEIFHNTVLTPEIHICHHCDNPSCINPEHLFAGTHSDNMKDCVKKGRYAAKLGTKNHFHKLKEQEVAKIKEKLRFIHNVSSIAKEFNVSQDTIYLIRQNKIWRHVA